jgi:hypothetical protein
MISRWHPADLKKQKTEQKEMQQTEKREEHSIRLLCFSLPLCFLRCLLLGIVFWPGSLTESVTRPAKPPKTEEQTAGQGICG